MLLIPALLLLGSGLALGLVPQAAEHAEVAAANFRDRDAYDRAVLDGVDRRTPVTPHPLSTTGAWYGLATAGGAVTLAAASLHRQRLSARRRARLRPVLAPVVALRAAHTGHVGDYVMWFTVGLAALGGLLIRALR